MINGIKIIPLDKYDDSRGWLIETYRSDILGPGEAPVMSYLSMTKPAIARGPHEHREQTDIFAFVGPSVFKLYLWDNRPNSPTFKEKQTLEAGENSRTLVIVPPGVVHAYQNVGERDGLVLNYPSRLYRGEGKKEPVDEIRHEDDQNSEFKLD